jgi:hypothetical protein
MRNIDIPGAKEIFAKQDELLNTFWQNRGYVKALSIIHQEAKKDYVSDKMLKMRGRNRINMCNDIYDRAAAAYYAKHGTQGEF